MTDTQRHNIRVFRQNFRGKRAEDVRRLKPMLRAGPIFGTILAVIQEMEQMERAEA